MSANQESGLRPADSTQPHCSVIIPVYNGENAIGQCLDALTRQTADADSFETIVVNDGSTDATGMAILHWMQQNPTFQLRVIEQENAGPASARNRGAAVARGAILLFTDADCQPVPGWIEALRQPFEQDPSVVASMGAYASKQQTAAARFAQLEFEDRYRFMAEQPYLDLVATYSAAFDRNVFQAMQGFDSSFPEANNEDVEFSYRLSEQGYRMVFAPQARVYHQHSERWAEYARTKFGRAYWRTIVYFRHPAKAVKDTYTPQTLKVQIVLAPFVPLSVLASLVFSTVAWLWLAAPFLLTTLSMMRLSLTRTPSIAPWIPWGLWLRSTAFALGVGWALVTRGLSFATPVRRGKLRRA